MLCAITDLCCVRVAVVQVNKDDIDVVRAQKLIRSLQRRFGGLPIMLVHKPTFDWSGVQGYSDFPTPLYLAELIASDDAEWGPLPPEPEDELPF